MIRGVSKINGMVLQVVFLAVLLFLIKGAEMSPNQMVCDSDSRVKLSVLNGLREQHVLKEIRVHELEREVDEARKQINDAEVELGKMQRKINTTLEEAEGIEKSMANMTTPELEQLEELEICSEAGFVADCCQVNH